MLLQELSPPLVDDFLYLCDDAYTHDELLKMEQDIFKTVHYDINIPVAYRFLRRLAKVKQTHETDNEFPFFVAGCRGYHGNPHPGQIHQ